jgi:alkanesulfonate monooxygenase SsuD/methylene tetrahydromethanopterin reductase-like flavin-dependent oxidoreductase (luciferase family)
MLDEAVDLEYLADNLWFVGSPQTVAERILDLQDRTGGFGHLLIVSYDATNELQAWERSLQLLMDEVRPLLHKRPPASQIAAMESVR